MYCAICKSELEREEDCFGNFRFSCPLCGEKGLTSTSAPKEKSIIPGDENGAIAMRYGLEIMELDEDGVYPDEDEGE